MKLMCILLPHFPLKCEVLRTPALAGRPVIIARTHGSVRTVLDYSAELAGLEKDMPLQQALAVHGGSAVIHADVAHYREVYNRLLDGLESKSPLVEGADGGNIYLGLDGLQTIYADDDRLARSVHAALPAVFTARLGIAEGKFPACAAALNSQPGSYRALTGDLSPFLRGLSCELLPVPFKMRERLRSFGLFTLGQVADIPAHKLAAQFGPAGYTIWKLANGRDDTSFHPRPARETIEESVTLTGPTSSLEVIVVTLENLLSHIFTRLLPGGPGIRSVNLWTRSFMEEHWEQEVRFKEPAMSPRGAISRIKQAVENTPQPGPVEKLGIRVTATGKPAGRQKSLLPEVRAREHFVEEIKQMEARLGGPQLFRIKELEPWSRMPERRYALVPLNL